MAGVPTGVWCWCRRAGTLLLDGVELRELRIGADGEGVEDETVLEALDAPDLIALL